MRILVTGAGGFLGQSLAAALPQAFPDAKRVVLTDRTVSPVLPQGAQMMAGDLGDPAFLAELLEPGFDLVFHLASVPGSLAEREQVLGHRVNLLAPLALAEAVATRRPGARFVFASSIAVYGDLGGSTVTAKTPAVPLLTYGAHKLMTEILLADLSRRATLSAISLRFPGIVARPMSESGHGSAFMSQIFHKIAAGEAYECPVPETATCWWMSRKAAVNILLHAARLADPGGKVVQPPVLHANLHAVAAAVSRVGGKPARISWGNDQSLQRIFGSMPPLDAALATALGFQADADLEALAKSALSGE